MILTARATNFYSNKFLNKGPITARANHSNVTNNTEPSYYQTWILHRMQYCRSSRHVFDSASSNATNFTPWRLYLICKQISKLSGKTFKTQSVTVSNEMEIGSGSGRAVNYNIKPTLIKAIIKKDSILSAKRQKRSIGAVAGISALLVILRLIEVLISLLITNTSAHISGKIETGRCFIWATSELKIVNGFKMIIKNTRFWPKHLRKILRGS